MPIFLFFIEEIASVHAMAPASVVKYGMPLFRADLLKDLDSSIDFFPEVVLITIAIFLSSRYSTT